MITLREARQVARRFIEASGPDNKLIEDVIVEYPYGWYFEWRPDSKTYKKEFNDFTLFVVDTIYSCPPFIVERDTGTPYMLPISHRFDASALAALKHAYDADFRYRLSDLIIHDVYHVANTIDFLYELHIAYVHSAGRATDAWQPPVYYTREELRALIKTLPLAFSGYNFFWSYPIFEKYNGIECCLYSLKPHRTE